MTITRLAQLTGETAHRENAVSYSATYWQISQYFSNPGLNLLNPTYTGDYAYNITSLNPTGVGFTARNELRTGYWIYFSGFTGSSAVFFTFHLEGQSGTSTTNHRIQYNTSLQTVEMYVEGVLVSSVDANILEGFYEYSVWRHVAVTIKADATDGFFSFYWDGNIVLNYTGAIATGIDGVLWGSTGFYFNGDFSRSSYADDVYLDDTTGEEDDQPPMLRFLYLRPAEIGVDSEWTPKGDTDNALTVDDVSPDGDTTFNHEEIAGDRDTFIMEDISVPANHVIRAVIPLAYAKRNSSTLNFPLTLSAYDGATYQDSDGQPLKIIYGEAFARFDRQNDGTAWDATDLNNYQFGYKLG